MTRNRPSKDTRDDNPLWSCLITRRSLLHMASLQKFLHWTTAFILHWITVSIQLHRRCSSNSKNHWGRCKRCRRWTECRWVELIGCWLIELTGCQLIKLIGCRLVELIGIGLIERSSIEMIKQIGIRLIELVESRLIEFDGIGLIGIELISVCLERYHQRKWVGTGKGNKSGLVRTWTWGKEAWRWERVARCTSTRMLS